MRGVSLLAASLVIVSCAANAPAATTPTVTPVAASATPAPTASPCPTLGPVTAPAPSAGTPAPTPLPAIAANTTLLAVAKIPIPPIAGKTASIDIMEIDQAAHRLYVTDRTDNGIDVFDVATSCAKYVKTIATGSGPNGVVVAKNVNKIFAGLNDSNVAIIDIAPGSSTTDTVIAKVSTGGKMRADELDYDSKDKKIYIANSDDGIVTVIDASTNAIVKKFDNLGEGLEQPRYDSADGMMYMTSSVQNAVFKFDPTKDTMVQKYDVVAKCSPNGLAINPTTNQALLGCSARAVPIAVSWDLAGGKVLTTFDQTGAGDGVFYSAKADRFFFAASNFNRGGVMSIFKGNPIAFVTNIPTAVGAHGVAYDEANDVIYTQDQNPNEGALFSFSPPR